MLPSVFALSAPRKPQKPARHNIACGLLDVFACKHCRRARHPQRREDRSPPGRAKAHKEQHEPVFGKYLTPPGAFSSRNTNLAASRRHSLSTSDLPNSTSNYSEGILKPSPSSDYHRHLGHDSNLKKQARFSESVSVIVHDLDGQELMKDEVRLKKPASPTDDNAPVCVNIVNPKKHQERPFCLEKMETEQRSGVTFLKVIVHLGLEYMNDRVEIHSGKLGQSVVVVAFKLEPLGDGTDYYKRYMQKFRLTEAINPYAIDATLLSKGFVKIRAPLLPADE